MKSLQELFTSDRDALKNLHEYQVQFIKDRAVEMLFERENTDAIADAKELIDASFENLELLFQPKAKKKLTNESR